jgi:hypothetical protein
VGHHIGRGTTAAAMVHSVLADDDSYGVLGTSKHTDSYIRNNNRCVKKIANICNACGWRHGPIFVLGLRQSAQLQYNTPYLSTY